MYTYRYRNHHNRMLACSFLNSALEYCEMLSEKQYRKVTPTTFGETDDYLFIYLLCYLLRGCDL